MLKTNNIYYINMQIEPDDSFAVIVELSSYLSISTIAGSGFTCSLDGVGWQFGIFQPAQWGSNNALRPISRSVSTLVSSASSIPFNCPADLAWLCDDSLDVTRSVIYIMGIV